MPDSPQPRRTTEHAEAPTDPVVIRFEESSSANLGGPEGPRFAAPARAGEMGTFGRYRVLQKLGMGGMGAVYLGYDAALDRKVALKVMLPQFAVSNVARERFLREARLAAKVKSDHVVTIFDVGEQNHSPFIAMEYLLGMTLDVFLKTRGDLPLHQALRVVRETALGLSAAHELGMIHRDIKPANIWLEAPKGRVKILDFGLARSDEEGGLTRTGAVIGTPAYMSPEQGRAVKIDSRADLFSLGVVLYRLVTGKMPFTGGTPLALLTSIAVDEPVPPRRHNPQLPPSVEAALALLLAKEPDRRFQTAQEVADALEEIANPQTPSSGSVPVLAPLSTSIPVLAVIDPPPQPSNVWEGIDASGVMSTSAETPAEMPAERTLAPEPKAARHTPERKRKPSKWPPVAALVAIVALAAVAAVLAWPKKKPEVAPKDEPSPPQKKDEKPPPKKDDKPPAPKGVASTAGTVYDIPKDLIPPMTPVKPQEVFSLDHLDPAKHVPPEEKFDWQPKELVAVLGSHRQRAGPQLSRLEISPDGDTLLVGHMEPTHAFRVSTGQFLDWKPAQCFSPDGKRLANGNEVWSIDDPGRRVSYPIEGVIRAFLTDDLVLASGPGLAYTVWRLDAKAPKQVETFPKVAGFAVSRDRKYLALANANNARCAVYDITADGPKPKAALPGPDGQVPVTTASAAMSFSDTGVLATLDQTGSVRVWDVAGAAPVLRTGIEADAAAWRDVLSTKGDRLVLSAKGDRLVRANHRGFEVWSLAGAKPARIGRSPDFRQFESDSGCAGLTPDGETIVTVHDNAAVRFWAVENDTIVERRPVTDSPLVDLAYSDFSPDGRSAALFHEDRHPHLWNLAEMRSRPLDAFESAVRFSPDGATCAVRFTNQWLYAVPAQSGPGAYVLAEGLRPMCHSPDGKWLAALSPNAELVIWDLAASVEKFDRVPGVNATLVRFTPDGQWILAHCTQDGGRVLKVWAVTPRGLVPRQEGALPGAHAALSPDGKTLVADGGGTRTRVYELKDGVLKLLREGSRDAWAGISPDGKALLVGVSNGLQLLDTASGKVLREWTLRGTPLGGRFHPDGRHVFVTNADRTTYVLRLPRDADRAAAEYALSLGGTVCVNGERRWLGHVSSLPAERFTLTAVNLNDNTKVTDTGLGNFKGCTSLTELALRGTQMTDAGLTHLKGCSSLNSLVLANNPRVTDAGLAALARHCPGLTSLNVEKTGVTEDGVLELRKALPKCQVVWDGDTDPPKK